MSEPRGTAQQHAFDEELIQDHGERPTLVIEDLRDVPATVTAELGHASMLVREVLALDQGSVLPLSKSAGEMADVLVNGIPIARGEVVVLGDSINIRIAEIFGLSERDILDS